MATTSGIYEIRNKITGHCYIGSAVKLAARKRKHFWRLRKGNHHSPYLQNALNKYGEDAFEWLVLEEVPDITQLIQCEQYWIDTRHPKYNWNPTAGSRLGSKQPEQAIEKLRIHNRQPEVRERALQSLQIGWELPSDQRYKRTGETNSEEQNRKIAESHEGLTHKPESIEKMRLAKKGKKQSPEVIQKRVEGMQGHVVSEEARRKSAESNRATWAKKTVEEKHAIATNRPPISSETRKRQSEAHLGKSQDPALVTKRIQASWGSKTEEEKAAINAKRKATWAAKRNQSPEVS